MTNKRLFSKLMFEGDPFDFLDGVRNVTVIISLGSCVCADRKGHFRTLMFYNDKVKFFEDDIDTNSANVCILQGMLTAIRYIKKPTRIYLVSGTPLGFHSKSGPNRSLCEQVYAEVVQKNCNAEIVEILGEAERFKKYFNDKLLVGKI